MFRQRGAPGERDWSAAGQPCLWAQTHFYRNLPGLGGRLPSPRLAPSRLRPGRALPGSAGPWGGGQGRGQGRGRGWGSGLGAPGPGPASAAFPPRAGGCSCGDSGGNFQIAGPALSFLQIPARQGSELAAVPASWPCAAMPHQEMHLCYITCTGSVSTATKNISLRSHPSIKFVLLLECPHCQCRPTQSSSAVWVKESHYILHPFPQPHSSVPASQPRRMPVEALQEDVGAELSC